ncbi:hypothetical protein EYF80_004916 [Liparis tanakae]|uniref:Uncharacterized protein n=1 Tax=Liparis tanakae TaxID=230148 RepID=A0A4Z2J4J7_9TELE|nr:hypothetical protein EYF80_004916 [Liparis tanakae]
MGQHSPSGMMGSAQSEVSSQITSSHMTVPLSQTQIWQGSGWGWCSLAEYRSRYYNSTYEEPGPACQWYPSVHHM